METKKQSRGKSLLSRRSHSPSVFETIMKWIWQTITSLKLTVTCLSFSMLIVFVGTPAQVDQGLYLVQDRYFKSLLYSGT